MKNKMDENKAGIIWIAFHKNADDDDIQRIVSKFYKENAGIIEGMEFNQIDKVLSLRQVKTIAKSVLSGETPIRTNSTSSESVH